MSKQQKNSAFVKMLKEFPKVFGRVSFRERLMLRTAFDYVVEEVIADIKANCDYVLEGKDLEIKQLKMTDEYIIKTLESKVEKLQEDLRNKRISIKNKKAKIKELELELTVEKDQHQEEINLHLHAEDYIKELERLNSNQAESLRVTMLEEEKKRKRIEELEKVNADQKDQLTKAKEIIKVLLSCCRNYPQENAEKVKQAEQFLKEIEK